MNRAITLTAIDLDAEKEWLNNLRRASQPAAFRNVEFAEDDLERPIVEDDEAPAPAANLDLSNPPNGVYSEILVFENDIREIYPRRGDRTGTRIVYRSGAARPVKESFADVKAKFSAIGCLSAPPAGTNED